MLTTTFPRGYRDALAELESAAAQARTLAEALTHFARLLRGGRRDPEDPFLGTCPLPSEVRRALDRVQRALDAARDEWARLPDDLRERCEPPEEMLGRE
jgi:hypothetical protein